MEPREVALGCGLGRREPMPPQIRDTGGYCFDGLMTQRKPMFGEHNVHPDDFESAKGARLVMQELPMRTPRCGKPLPTHRRVAATRRLWLGGMLQ